MGASISRSELSVDICTYINKEGTQTLLCVVGLC